MATTKQNQLSTMDQIGQKYADHLVPFRLHDVVEATLNHVSSQKILVDLYGVAQGLVPQREFSFDHSQLKIGDKILAQVIWPENDDGLVVLSMKRADQEKVWRTINQKIETGQPVEVKVMNANRGGLIVNFGGTEGFIPVSHLTTDHYPKVEGGDPNMILIKLKPLVGQTLNAKVLTADRKAGKLIFSERAAGDNQIEEAFQHLKIDQIVQAKISGIVEFGLFVTFEVNEVKREIEGLIHRSEIAWDRQPDLSKTYKIGSRLKTKIISMENGRVALSLKQLEKNPWLNLKIKVGQSVEGELTRFTPFGIFVACAGVEAFVPRETLASRSTSQSLASIGQVQKFKVTKINLTNQKLTLAPVPDTQTSQPVQKKVKAGPKAPAKPLKSSARSKIKVK